MPPPYPNFTPHDVIVLSLAFPQDNMGSTSKPSLNDCQVLPGGGGGGGGGTATTVF